MFIKRRLGSKFERGLAIAVLLLILVLALVAWLTLGRASGIATAVILFLLLDGFDCVWVLLTYAMNQRIADRLDSDDEKMLRTGARDNPTLR